MKNNNHPNREGFWRSKQEPLLPLPVANEKAWKGKASFLEALSQLESRAEGMSKYKGYSRCRLCDTKNGSGEFRARGWVWPEGYAHYVKAHHVRPSLAFQEMVLGHRVGESE